MLSFYESFPPLAGPKGPTVVGGGRGSTRLDIVVCESGLGVFSFSWLFVLALLKIALFNFGQF